MSASNVYCHILGRNVSVVSNLNGSVTNVICPKFFRLTHGCMQKDSKSGFLSLFLKKVADITTGTRASYCEFVEPRNMFS